jgi:hypothetical protein
MAQAVWPSFLDKNTEITAKGLLNEEGIIVFQVIKRPYNP